MAATNKSKAEKEREKVQQDKCQAILSGMLKDEDNKYCVDCDSKGPRWASWNLGVFLCIRCAGIHRNLGVHISKVKSVNLDSWTPQQVASMQNMGNSKGRAVYEANLPDDFRRPTNDSAMEAFIRNKYEKKKFIAKEWVANKPPDLPVGWHELDQEKAAKSKEVKKIAPSTQPAAPNPTSVISRNEQLPASLPAVKAAPAVNSTAATAAVTSDLLGLSLTSQQHQQQSLVDDDLLGFSAFVSASPSVSTNAELLSQQPQGENNNLSEADFFNQISSGSSAGVAPVPGAESKMSKDSILALFGSRPAAPAANPGLFGAPVPAFGQTPLPGLGPISNGNQSALLGLNGAFATNNFSSPLQQQQFLGPRQQLPAAYPPQQLFQPVNTLLSSNPFLEPGPGQQQQPKMINTLPQNVFQINNQLSGLSPNPAPSLWQ